MSINQDVQTKNARINVLIIASSIKFVDEFYIHVFVINVREETMLDFLNSKSAYRHANCVPGSVPVTPARMWAKKMERFRA